MVSQERFGSALFSLNTVLVLTRAMAYDGKTGAALARVLDVAEVLPRLLAESVDRTSEFRKHLVQLSTIDKAFDLAVARFDQDPPARW